MLFPSNDQPRTTTPPVAGPLLRCNNAFDDGFIAGNINSFVVTIDGTRYREQLGSKLFAMSAEWWRGFDGGNRARAAGALLSFYDMARMSA